MEAALPPPRRLLAAQYLLLAVVLHGLLLLLPGFNQQGERAAQALLRIELQRPAASLPAPPMVQPETNPPIVPETDDQLRSSPVNAEPAVNAADAVENPRMPEAPPPLPSAARLLESVAGLQLTTPEPQRRLPARATHSEHYDAMRRPLLEVPGTLFNAYTAPLETEVVDRWQTPGGVHRVVIRTPGGRTFCGRQEPMDEFRPWTQIPMVFHECAGGGKR